MTTPRVAKPKFTMMTKTLMDAVADGYSIIEDLASEVREVVDNASGTNFENSQRIQTLSETADALEGQSEPDCPLPEDLRSKTVSVPSSLKKRQSRSDRRDDAVTNLQAAIDQIQDRLDEMAEGESVPDGDVYDLEQYRDELQSAVDDWESAEFPGMYG